jgi:hypothetical protein
MSVETLLLLIATAFTALALFVTPAFIPGAVIFWAQYIIGAK